MVDPPPEKSRGDFALSADGLLHAGDERPLTYAGIGVYRPSLFDDWHAVVAGSAGADADPPRFQLAPLLRAAMARGAVTGERHRGRWTDVGTPQRLAQLDGELRDDPRR